MTLGLAIQKVSEYTGAMQSITERVAGLEIDVMNATVNKDPNLYKEAMLKLTRLKTLLGLIKDFMEFWKEMIKSFLAMLKGINELAQGAR